MERKNIQITENLLTAKKQNRPGNRIIDLRALVIHWIGPYPKQDPIDTRGWWESGKAFGSAHYIISHEGAIMRTLPEYEVGYHIGSTTPDPVSKKVYTDKARQLFGEDVCFRAMNNFYSIGIEMCPIDTVGNFSNETLVSAIQLCGDILNRYRKDTRILTTHFEVVGWKRCPELWTDKPEMFENFKSYVKSLLI